jgi:perosamine synthetase
MGQRYNERLGSIAGLQLPCEKAWAKNVYWMYGVVLDAQRGMDANQLAALLAAKGVQSRPFFHGMHCQPAFARFDWFTAQHLPVTERLSRQGLYLPSGVALTEEQQEQVCAAMREVLS